MDNSIQYSPFGKLMHAILLVHFADVAKIDFQSLLSLADEGIDVSFLRPGIFLVVCLVANKFALLRGFFTLQSSIVLCSPWLNSLATLF